MQNATANHGYQEKRPVYHALFQVLKEDHSKGDNQYDFN